MFVISCRLSLPAGRGEALVRGGGRNSLTGPDSGLGAPLLKALLVLPAPSAAVPGHEHTRSAGPGSGSAPGLGLPQAGPRPPHTGGDAATSGVYAAAKEEAGQGP